MIQSHFHTTDLGNNQEITIWFSLIDWGFGPRFCTYSNFTLVSCTLGPIGITFTQWRPT